MAKLTFHGRIEREHRGKTYVFYVYRDARMQHVFGNGDKESTGRPAQGDDGAVVTNSQTGAMLTRGRIEPGDFNKPFCFGKDA